MSQIPFGKAVGPLPMVTLLYGLCRRYVHHYNGENNCDMRTNGDLRWRRQAL